MEPEVWGWLIFLPLLPDPAPGTSLQGLRPCATLQIWAQLHKRPFWPCSVILQHEADGLHCYERTSLWAVVSREYHVASRTGLLVLDNSVGTAGTGPIGFTATDLPATAGLSSAALRSQLLLGVT